MANRQPVDRGRLRARITPIATPVDTFVQQKGSTGLSQLAESLRDLAPAVSQFSDVQAKRQSKRDQEAGAKAAREFFESGKSAREAIKAGLIRPDESSWFQLGAKEQMGRVSAGRFSTDLQNAIENDPKMQESTNVGDFDKFLGEFRKSWLKENVGDENRDLHFERGFGAMSDAYTEDSRRQFVAQAGNRLVKQVGDNHYQEVFQMLDHEVSMNTKPEAIAEALNLLNDRSIATGMNPRSANLAMVQALGDLVQRDGNTELFDVLKKVRTGSGNLYSTAFAQDTIQRVTDYAAVKKQQQHTADRERVTEQRAEASRATVGEITSAWIASDNPAKLDFTPQIAALAKIDPPAAESLIRFQATVSGAKFESNPQVVNHTLASIFSASSRSPEYVTSRTLVGLLNAKEINQQDFAFLRSQIDSRDDNARQMQDRNTRISAEKSPYTDPQFRDALKDVRSLFVSEYDGDPQKNQRASSAQAEFIQRYLDWNQGTGKGADYKAKNEFLTWLKTQVAPDFQTREQRNEAGKVPKPKVPGEPAHDWDTRVYGTAEQFNQVDTELRSPDGLSAQSIAMLQKSNIKPNEMVQFIEAQRKLRNAK